jgi:hypothetical protein
MRVKLERRAKNAIIIAEKKKVLVLLIFSLIG